MKNKNCEIDATMTYTHYFKIMSSHKHASINSAELTIQQYTKRIITTMIRLVGSECDKVLIDKYKF